MRGSATRSRRRVSEGEGGSFPVLFHAVNFLAIFIFSTAILRDVNWVVSAQNRPDMVAS